MVDKPEAEIAAPREERRVCQERTQRLLKCLLRLWDMALNSVLDDEFPMTVTGKVRKVQMREETTEKLGLG